MSYIIAVDQSTASTKALLLDEGASIRRALSLPHSQRYPKPGYVEHDANEIFQNVARLIERVSEGVPPGQITALAIANQRESVAVWDRATGEPLCPLIVWQDARAAQWCAARRSEDGLVRAETGLPLSPYYSAAKVAAALEEYPGLRQADFCVGTIDSYIIYRLTEGRTFATDTSNASRTMLMRLGTLDWSEELCALFGIPSRALPEIRHADARFGHTRAGIPIVGVMGDSHAALFGHGCVARGMAKATYGTGSSVMMNVGHRPVPSSRGLTASVGFSFQGRTHYAIEGNVLSCGDTLCWLRDQLGVLPGVGEAERIAQEAGDTQGVFFVPAFTGLGAPHDAREARAMLCGISRGTTAAQIIRAALESIAHQDADILERMAGDAGTAIRSLGADGGPTANRLLMQMQADFVPVRVACAPPIDLSAMGAGYMAGLALGMYPSLAFARAASGAGEVFEPAMPPEERALRRAGWAEAVARAVGAGQ